MLRVSKIRMEYEENPVGLGSLPWFGWVLVSDRKNVLQTAYQLQIARGTAFLDPVYDSGWVNSPESAHVTELAKWSRRAAGDSPGWLRSCTRYFVRARVRDGVEESPFSPVSSFVTALLDGTEWQASFISAEFPADRDRSGSTYLRKRIRIEGEVESAYVCVTALGLYQLYINGKRTGGDELTPGWTSYRKHLCYQTYDVTGLLSPGENTIGALVGAGWYKGKMGFLLHRNNYGERTALLLQLVVRCRDGREEIFSTDESWLGTDGPVLFSEIYDGEIYDAGKEIPDFSRNSLDTSDWRPVEKLEFPMEALTPQAAGKVRVMETLPVYRIFKTPQGDTVLDFGQNLTGWPQFRVRAQKGREVRLRCFETLDADGNVYTANLRSAKQEIRYFCKGEGEETFRPHFTFQGFRYIHVIEWPGEPLPDDFTACVLYSRMERTGSFSCSHPLVNRLQKNILWSMKGNFLDIPMDCPQRDERMGWTGDAQIFCRTACYQMNTYTFYRKWLKDVAADQTPEGGVPHMVPDIISGREETDWLLSQGTHSAAAWADVAVILPWTLYLVFGDKVILEEQYESMKKWVGFMREHAVDDIWNYRLQFGDWVALDAEEGSYFGATPNDLTCTAYYAYSTGLLARIAGILDRKEDARAYRALYERIVAKFQRTFFTKEGFLTAQTQTAHIIALYFDLAPETYREKTAGRLKELLEKEGGHLVTGFVGTPYFCHALSGSGYGKEAYALLEKEDFPSWLYQVKAGATTIWEHWDGLKPDGTMWSPDMNSFNHYAYGAVGDWLYRVVLGLEIDERDPGYHHSVISPRTDTSLRYAEGSYESIYGRIRIRWEQGEDMDTRILNVTIPHNTTASLILEPGACLLDGGELYFSVRNGLLQADCGSGNWQVRYQIL